MRMLQIQKIKSKKITYPLALYLSAENQDTFIVENFLSCFSYFFRISANGTLK
jgi:hypothetical protein